MNRKKYFVYAHYSTGSLEPFYIGKGTGNRDTSTHGRNKHWKNIVNKYGYTIKIISKDLTPEEASQKECFWIEFFGRKDLQKGNLVNYTDGGEGITGRIIPEEHKRYGKDNPFYGKTHSKETSKIIAEANKKRIWTNESKQKLVNSHIKITDFGIRNPKSNVILNIETGIYYMSIREVSEAYSIPYEAVRWMINPKNKKPKIFIDVTK